MVYDYVITLKKHDYRFVDQVSHLMLLFAIVVLSYFFYLHPKTGVTYIVFAAAILLTGLFSVFKKRNTGSTYYRLPLLIAAIAWFYTGNIWMAILYGVAGILEKQVKFSQEIGFSENEIAFNSFPKRRLQWSEINNALIKDGLITIDQKNNKIFQKEIDSGVSLQVEKEFNEFCRQQLQNSVVS